MYCKRKKKKRIRTSSTKEGILFLIITLFVGIAALNTGNNLLYLIFGMMISAVITSGVISMLNLSRIDIGFTTSGDIFAMTPTHLRVHIRNSKPIPSYSLTLEIEDRKTHLLYLPSKKEKTVIMGYIFKKRGWNNIPPIRVYTRFPFGFFRKWVEVEPKNQRILVYPRLQKLQFPELNYTEGAEKETHNRAGSGDELRSLRPYNQGDSPKLIHWKTTAKAGKLMIRESHDNDSKRVVLRFNPVDTERELENQISYTTSLLLELLNRGFDVEFLAPDKTFYISRTGKSIKQALTYLALFRNQ